MQYFNKLSIVAAAMVLTASATQSVHADAATPFTGGTIYIIDNDAYNLGWAKDPIEGQWRNATFSYWDWGSYEAPVYREDGRGYQQNEDGTYKHETKWWSVSEGNPLSNISAYNMRPTFDFSGYAVTIDGKDYPVYKFTVPEKIYGAYVDADGELVEYDYQGAYEGNKGFRLAVDFKLIHEGSNVGYQDWEQADGNCFLFFGENRGVYKRNYDPATDPDTKLLTAEDLASHNGKTYKIYFNGNGDFDSAPQGYTQPDWSPGCRATHVHLWGPGGDFTPWALGKPCTRKAEFYNEDWGMMSDLYFWTGQAWKQEIYEFEFTYFGGNPEGIIFRQDAVQGTSAAGGDRRECPFCDESKNGMKDENLHMHDYYRCDFNGFIDGALYQYSPIGTVMPITNPKISRDYQWSAPGDTDDNLVDHSIWFIDTDNWIYLTDGETPDKMTDLRVVEGVESVTLYTDNYEGIVSGIKYGWYDNDDLRDYYNLEVVDYPASYTGLHGRLMGAHYSTKYGMNIESVDYGDGYERVRLTNNDNGPSMKCSYFSDMSTSPDVDVNMILVTQYVSSIWPWGVPMENMRIDYSEKGVRYVKMNGKWYPMYHIHFSADPTLDKFQLNNYGTPRTSAWMPIVEDGVYYYAGRDIACPIRQFSELTDVTEPVATRDLIPEDDDKGERYIYVNLGANQVLQTDLWKVPYAMPIKRDSYSNPHGTPYKPMSWQINPETGQFYYYNKMLNIPNLPDHVKKGATGYDDSELARYEMIPVDGHPGMWKFRVDDVSKYNDFLCWYYVYGTEAKLKECTREEFLKYLTDNGYELPQSETGDFPVWDDDNKYIMARRNWTNPVVEYRKVKIVTNADGEFKDADGNSTKIKVEHDEWSSHYNYNSPTDDWIYIEERHSTAANWGSDSSDCPEINGATTNKYCYFKVKLDHSYDYVDLKYNIPSNGFSNAMCHGYASSNFPEGSETPWSDGWRAAQLITVPGYATYEIFDHWGDMDEPETIPTANGYSTNMAAYPASRSRWHDPTVWADVVYDIGEDCLHQSYMTPEQYLNDLPKIPSPDIPAVYLVGNKTVMGNDNYNLREAVKVENERGAFFHDFSNVTPDMAAEFKVSIVDVNKYATDAEDATFEGYYNYQRGWATFNLGLIGPFKDPESEGYDAWYKDHVVDGSPTRKVRVNTDETYDYTTFSQYSWRIEVDEEGTWHGMKPSNYYFVIDFIPGEETITLLDFDPHPHPVFNGVELRTVDLDDDASRALHYGNAIPGHEHNPGTAKHQKVNVLKAGIDIGDTAAKTIAKEGFKVLYTIYIDDQLAYYTDTIMNDGKPKTIMADYLNLSEDTKIAVRGRYYDTKTKRYFSSKLRNEKISNILAELPGLKITNEDAIPQQLKFYWVDPEDHNKGFYMGVVTNIEFEPENTEAGEDAPAHNAYEMLPGYEVKEIVFNNTVVPVSAVSAPLLHKDHEMVTTYGWPYYLGNADDDNTWTPNENPGDMTDWSSVAKQTGTMPIFLHNIAQLDYGTYLDATVTAKIDLIASYPFLVRDFGKDIITLPEEFDITAKVENPEETGEETGEENTEVATAPRRAEEGESATPTNALPADLSKYSVSMVNRPSPVSLAPEGVTLSGVEDVRVDGLYNLTGEVEYYNIQGMRIPADSLTPGVYLRRQGNKVEKIVVR